MTHNLIPGSTYRDAHGRAFTPTVCQDADAQPGHALTADCFDLARAYSAPMCQPIPVAAADVDVEAPHYCEPCGRAGAAAVVAVTLIELDGIDRWEAVCRAHADAHVAAGGEL